MYILETDYGTYQVQLYVKELQKNFHVGHFQDKEEAKRVGRIYYKEWYGTDYIERDYNTCRKGHKFTKENTRINSKGKRVCITCNREGQRRRYYEQKAKDAELMKEVNNEYDIR